VFVHGLSSIMVFALIENGLAVVVLGAVAILLAMSVMFLLAQGSGSVYDQIGAGGMSQESDHGDDAPAIAPDSPAARAEREREIRQMLSARSERLVRRGQPALDVDCSPRCGRSCWPATSAVSARACSRSTWTPRWREPSTSSTPSTTVVQSGINAQ
jgi:hypothetical protein